MTFTLAHSPNLTVVSVLFTQILPAYSVVCAYPSNQTR
jgi:hypothetical protein